jgi:hypothetical protein
VTPDQLLTSAREMLEADAFADSGWWPRSVALLTRQALEKGLDEFWGGNAETAGLPGCSRKAQFACLPAYLDADLAHEMSFVWSALSNACHFHPYDLAPTATELRRWIEAVGVFLQSRAPAAASRLVF